MTHSPNIEADLAGASYVGTAYAGGPESRRSGLYGGFFKRALDVLAVLVSAPIVLPLLLAFGVLIARDGGPVFYSQNRIGRGGKTFRIWKLRSMVVDADAALEDHLAADPAARAEWDEHQKLRNDPRITSAGRLIRKTSLDELPQLWNVLTGDMSLVGPRPVIHAELVHYEANLRWYLSARPGLTGSWQVSGRNDVGYSERVALDVEYVRNLSLRRDALILLRTPIAMLTGRGAY